MNSTSVLTRAAVQISKIQEASKYEGSLMDYAEYVWPVVEPAIPFVRGWAIEAIAEHLEAVTNGHIRKLLMNVPPGFTKSLMTDVFWPSWEWGPRNMPWLRYVCASYSSHLTERDNMRCRNIVISDRYKKLWGNRFRISNEQFTKIKFANDHTGWKLATSVGGIGVGERGDRFIIDDPNNTMEMEYEATRNTTNLWFTEVVPDRLNNPQESAIVVIQQRLHEDDVSGTALSRKMGFTHLMIPMEHDVSRHCKTFLGWNGDGNEIVWEDPRKTEGELAWPERFTEQVCNELQRDKGPYAWCSSAEAPVLMADLSMKRIDEISVGDKIVGFETGTKDKRARYKRAEVISISKSVRAIVKITLDSGHTVRCTEDHKWFTGRNDSSHPMYAPAYAPGANKPGDRRRGSKLIRVCPPALAPISAEQTRTAGWLSGFFDGEGTVSVYKRREGERSSLIQFSQTAERNLPLCEKLESALTELGFSWEYHERRPTLSAGGVLCQQGRNYYLKSDAGKGFSGKGSAAKRASRFTLNQRFLHVVQPTKWRDRLIETTVSGRMYTSSERVVSIEPDGEGLVYGLETTTGNYVVWGLASSNSGQYMQSPEPRGGSIIKRDFWQLWTKDHYPPFEFVLASLDTAYTMKEENDASALTIWGVFRDETSIRDVGTEALWMPRDGELSQTPKPIEGNPRLMLIYAWQERLEFHDLLQKVIDTCTMSRMPKNHPQFPVDRLLVESKASGMSIGHELLRLFTGSGKLGIELINPTMYGDKIARVHAIQHIFADGMIYAPDKAFADMVIDQCAVFPKGSRDDLVDSTSQAIRWLRDMGFALRPKEYAVEAEEDMLYKSPRSSLPLYPA